jgi:hypothetical protein
VQRAHPKIGLVKSRLTICTLPTDGEDANTVGSCGTFPSPYLLGRTLQTDHSGRLARRVYDDRILPNKAR